MSSILVVVIVVVMGAIAMAVWMGSNRYQDIPAREVLARMEMGADLLIIDVREPAEYAAGHIPGAVLIPLGELRSRLGELDKELEVFVVCRSGIRSRTAAKILAENGFRQIRNISDGMLAWEGPIEQ